MQNLSIETVMENQEPEMEKKSVGTPLRKISLYYTSPGNISN